MEFKSENFLSNCDLLHDTAAIELAIKQLAQKITIDLSACNPVVICVMNGGLIFSGYLLSQLSFPLELDYLHATRYGAEQVGSEICWLAEPQLSLHNRSVLILDDILDKGITLQAVVAFCRKAGAHEVHTAVLVKKIFDKPQALTLEADYIGLRVPDRYVFGMGMDYRGYWRNARGIYALKEQRGQKEKEKT